MKTLDDGLAEAISSILWVAPRLQADVQELKVMQHFFILAWVIILKKGEREEKGKILTVFSLIKLFLNKAQILLLLDFLYF